MKAGGKGCTCECTCRPSIEDRQTYVYRAFSNDGVLLYIGITYDMPARMKQHAKGEHSKRWFVRTKEIVAHLYRDRTEAQIVEQRALASECAEVNDVSDARFLKVEGPMPDWISSEVHRGGLVRW